MSHSTTPLTGYVRFPETQMEERLAEFQALMAKRRTIRDFADTSVPKSMIELAIKSAGTAPSGANLQPWHFVAISDPETKAAIREAAEAEEQAFYGGRASDEWLDALAPLGTDDQKPFLETAPWLIAAFAQKRGDHGKNYYVTESVGLATGMLITALHSVGLGTLTHTPAPMTFLREICGRPETEKPFVLLVVGYPAEGCTVPSHALKKKPLDEIATFLT